jgi:hypothetical protein
MIYAEQLGRPQEQEGSVQNRSRPEQYSVNQEIYFTWTPLPKPPGTLPFFLGSQNFVTWLLPKNGIRVELGKAAENPEM